MPSHSARGGCGGRGGRVGVTTRSHQRTFEPPSETTPLPTPTEMPSHSARGGRGGRGGRVGVTTRSHQRTFEPPSETTPLPTPTHNRTTRLPTNTTPLPTSPATTTPLPTSPATTTSLHTPTNTTSVHTSPTTTTPLHTPTNTTSLHTPTPPHTLTPTRTTALPTSPTTTTPLHTPTPTSTIPLPTPTTTTYRNTPTASSGSDGPLHPHEAQAARSKPKKGVRGPTLRTVETTRRPGDGPVRVEFMEGRSISQVFTTSIGVWIREIPVIMPTFNDIPKKYRKAFFKRIVDNFVLVELEEAPAVDNPAGRCIVVRPPTPGASSSSAPTCTTPIASSSRLAPTPVGQSSGATDVAGGEPEEENDREDLTLVLPCSPGTRNVIAGVCRDYWKRYMSTIRKKYYDIHATREERLAHRPPLADKIAWEYTVDYWSTESYRGLRGQNSLNHSCLEMLPTTGSRPFAAHRKDIVEKTGMPVHEAKFFAATRKRKDGSFSDEKAKKVVEDMALLEEQYTEEDGTCSLDTTEIVAAVVGPDKKGRRRLHGRSEPKPRPGGICQATLQSLREEMRVEMQGQMQDMIREVREEARREVREEIRREREQHQSQFPESVQAALAIMSLATLPPHLRVPSPSGSQS